MKKPRTLPGLIELLINADKVLDSNLIRNARRRGIYTTGGRRGKPIVITNRKPS